MVFPPKSPGAKLDYKFDWAPKTNGDPTKTDWLEAGETIASYSVSADSGITIDSDTLADNNTSVVVWVSGGTDGTRYKIKCAITTTLGRKAERTAILPVAQQ